MGALQISKQNMSNQVATATDLQTSLKSEAVYKATIVERKANKEAVVNIRGKNTSVVFNGEIPKTDEITVEVLGKRGDIHEVRVITQDQKHKATRAQQDIKSVLQKLGAGPEPSATLKQAAQLLLDKGLPLTKESIQSVNNFLEKETGTIEQKLITIQAVATKGLEMTQAHLRAVHATLYGTSISDVVMNIAKEIDPTFEPKRSEPKQGLSTGNIISTTSNQSSQALEKLVREARTIIINESSIPKAIEKITKLFENNPDIDSKLVKEILRMANQSLQLVGVGKQRLEAAIAILEQEIGKVEPLPLKQNLNDMLKSSLTQLKSDASIQNVIAGLRQNVLNQLGNGTDFAGVLQDPVKLEKIAKERLLSTLNEMGNTTKTNQLEIINQTIKQVQKEPSLDKVLEYVRTQNALLGNSLLEKALTNAVGFQNKGRELAARQELIATLTNLQNEFATKVNQPTEDTYTINDDIFAGFQAQAKNIIVTTVTQKMSQMTIDFKEMKRDISRNLDNVQRLIEQLRNNAQPQAKQILESTIKKLDHAILRSDLMLFTDMSTEKKLMQASSQLAEAKKLLGKGDYSEASKIVKQVNHLIEKVNFTPSDVKVKHFVSEESLRLENQPATKQVLNQVEKMVQPLAEPSARGAFELIRSLGLNHDSELGQTLASRHSENVEQQNLKSALLKLLQSDGEGQTRLTQQADQALQNLTGQQLLSKADPTSLQTMLINLPYLLKDQVENIKIHVNSTNTNQTVDWENCSIFFLLETKKLGEVGIQLTANDRNLSITFKNDKENFKENMEPLTNVTKDNLSEIGYNVGGFIFKKMTIDKVKQPLNQNEQVNPTQPKKTATFTEKGYDFTI